MGGYRGHFCFWLGGLSAVPPARHSPMFFWIGGLYNPSSVIFRKHGTLIFG